MVRCFLMIMLMVTILSTPALARERKQDKKSDAAKQVEIKVPSQEAKQEKDILVANINAMRNREIKVAVLQQLLNEEIANLRQMQAVFCDQYKLDPDKFRSGLYIYDEEKTKFVEREKTQ
ncbi:MAG: hypothetical protein KAJ66_02955 [Candidatus Omnitrophica bacterium]|nr:hypothetical protein [Candidatus Omnitrophota bacterium]